MRSRALPIQEQGLILLIGIAVLVTGVLVFSGAPPSSTLDAPAPIQLQNIQILIPRFVESAPLNINDASRDDLTTLPGIGPALAQRIIDYRMEHGPFASVEELERVSGIGPITVQDIIEAAAVVSEAP